MTEQGFVVLRAAINIARDQRVRCLSTLRRILTQRGFDQSHIGEALQEWANYEKAKQWQ